MQARNLCLFCAFLCPPGIGRFPVSLSFEMAGTTGLEPAASAVTNWTKIPNVFLGVAIRRPSDALFRELSH
jgi:hypothetical protein